MSRGLSLLATITCLLPLSSPVVGAQGSRDCSKAAKIVAKGRSPKANGGAYYAILDCGKVGANAIASGLRSNAAETDVIALHTFMMEVDRWRDATVFAAASRLARDSSATPQARVFAVRHLLHLVEPNHIFGFVGLTEGDDSTVTDQFTTYTFGCSGIFVGEMSHQRAPAFGTPLPDDLKAQVRAMLTPLANAPDTPKLVRNAAQCISRVK